MDENQVSFNVHRPSSFVPRLSETTARYSWRDWRVKLLRAVLFSLFLIFLALHFADPIRLVTADLGRHLKNGELILSGEYQSLHKNFYSYTQQDFPCINHHWGAGVLFYLVYQKGGFTALSFFYVGILLLTFIFFFRLAEKFSNFSCAFFFSVLALPVFSDRLEIRPEGISALCVGIYLYLLYQFKFQKISWRILACAILSLQLIWVNCHLFFFMGWFLIAVFFLDAWLCERNPRLARQLFILGLIAVGVSLINPAGLKGALVPFNILKEYGYRLAENQSVFFMQKRFPQEGKYLYFQMLTVLTLIGFGAAYFKRSWRIFLTSAMILLFFGALGYKTVRSMAMFGFVCVPFLSLFCYSLFERFPDAIRRRVSAVFLAAGLLLVIQGIVSINSYFSPYRHLGPLVSFDERVQRERGFGYLLAHPEVYTGLVPGVNRSAQFFNRLNIEGPIFNNYDIGGYLIFSIFPRVQLFVDNRPEAYSVPFFRDTYVPMQENNELWHTLEKQYNFNAIFFYRHDLTPWGQNFLVSRIGDPEWAPVFVDAFTIIFLKRNVQNQAVINAFELPRSMFAVSGGRQ